MPDFSVRAREEELMDDLTLASNALRQNLDELETINNWLGGYRVVLNALARLRPAFPPGRPLRLADLGSGGGDTLRHIAAWARQKQLKTELVGFDANAFMVAYATEKARSFPEISFRQQDIFSAEFQRQSFDIITCSLFCHHFGETELVAMLRQLKAQASVGVIINDLHRHPLAYYSIRWLTRLFRGSYLVQNDAPLSVARAFTRPDWTRMLAQAGIEKYELRWRWAFRWQVIF
ncbi:Methyltransferase domain-containing protein [Hymenobacter daecheongensis DSM 21074]|uniref:Methyltransferase domain-containing protein n=1 Tax=Hymenobacter daecheongensis DSM 21074 TaxID=1121955 RepID=A0A1M6L4K9_9BACT|nr:methyltransferase domain-containing protein [Hymenobacter daecheongensis]SHJ66137.1 Methyltransferase domain-containing protein [Hymenobacter daecheongensis DSM 21074]